MSQTLKVPFGGPVARPRLRSELLQNIWDIQEDMYVEAGELLLRYYEARLEAVDTAYLNLTCHQDVVDLITVVKQGADQSRQDTVAQLLASQSRMLSVQDEKAAGKALQFAVGLWLFMDRQFWLDGETLKDALTRLFCPPPAADRSVEKSRFTFEAYDLENVVDKRIEWTDRLDHHLRLDQDSPRIQVFRHALLLGSVETASSSSVLPPGLLQETSATVIMLYPVYPMPRRSRWYQKTRSIPELDAKLRAICNARHGGKTLAYWTHRLEDIQEVYERTQPITMRQWLHDWRDPNRAWAFWLAVVVILLTLIFGLIQSITGVLQVRYAMQCGSSAS